MSASRKAFLNSRMKKTSVTLPGFTPRPYPIGRAADLAAHSLSADSLVSVESVEVVNPSISGDSPVSVESIFEKPIGSTTNLLSEEFLSVFVFAARSTKPDIDPDSVPAPELGGAFADTELNAYVEDLPSIRDILFSFS